MKSGSRMVTRREKRREARERAWDKAHNVRTHVRDSGKPKPGDVRFTHYITTFNYSPPNRLDRKRAARWAHENLVPCEQLESLPLYSTHTDMLWDPTPDSP